MDGTAGEASCAGLILDGKFKLEKFLRHDGHASVYSVSAIPPETTSLEARAYSLEALPQKLRQYRLRNMKRLASRTVLETRWQGLVLIIYKAGGCEGNKDLGNSVLVETLPREKKPTPVPVNKKPHQKSGRQREKARIRQFERRKSTRQKERHLKGGECPADTSKNEVDVTKEANQKEPTPPLLHHTESDQPPIRKALAARCRTALENIFEQDLKLEDDEEGEDVLETVYREVRRLRHERKEQLEVLERRLFSATRNIPEIAYGGLIRPDPSQPRDEFLAGICGGSADLEVISQNQLLQLPLTSQKKEDIERQKRLLNALRARRIQRKAL
jgi:hypothetical protein